MSVPLPVLFARSLLSASKAFKQPTIEDSTQDLIRSSLSDLTALRSRVAALSLFSPNDTLEDIATKDLVYLFIPYVVSEVRGRLRVIDRDERITTIRHIQKDLENFLSYLEDYEIISYEERTSQKASIITDPAKRREHKIKQYKREKDLRARIENIQKRRRQLSFNSDDLLSDFDLVASLLPSSQSRATTDGDDEESDSETEDILRETTLLLLRLMYTQAHSQLQSTAQELELLLTAPLSTDHSISDEDSRRGKRREADTNMWKIDAPRSSLGQDRKGPLLDPGGKPLRPFTILPSDAANRAHIQAQVFGPGYQLPTMSIDEYLQIERERGNIITGGGPASEEASTSSEQLAIEAEMDGTRSGDEKAEIKRLQDEKWARYTDENPRGSGNTMNRG